MGWFGFLMLLAVVAGGIYCYQKLVTIEQEIRREQEEERLRTEDEAEEWEESDEERAADEVVKPDVAPPIFQQRVKLEPDPAAGPRSREPVSLEDGLLKVVNDLPGLLQTELYALFPGEEKKSLQALLLRLDRNGVIRREKKKSSYRVFPA